MEWKQFSGKRSTLKLERFILSKIFYDLCLYNLFSNFSFNGMQAMLKLKGKQKPLKMIYCLTNMNETHFACLKSWKMLLQVWSSVFQCKRTLLPEVHGMRWWCVTVPEQCIPVGFVFLLGHMVPYNVTHHIHYTVSASCKCSSVRMHFHICGR